MIENQRQYETTKDWIKEFEMMLAESAGEPDPAAENDRIAQAAETKSVRRILQDLHTQMRDYESRRVINPARDALALTTPPHRDTERAAYRGI